MIVFIEIPFSAGRGAYQAFTNALGADHVGWMDRNTTLADLKAGGAADRYRLVGGRFTLADALQIPGATRFASIVGDPVLRMLATWNAWERQARHPEHWLPHTFQLREALEAKIYPVMHSTEALMRGLRKAGVGTEIDRIVDDLKALPVTIGFGDSPDAFVEAIAPELGVETRDLNAAAFAEFGRTPNNAGLQHSIINGTVPDRTLHARLLAAAGGLPVLVTH